MSYLIIAIIFYILFVTCWITFHGLVSKRLSKKTHEFRQEGEVTGIKVLVFGDSVARGVGAKDSKNSLAGLIASDNPKASVNLYALDGVKIGQMIQEVSTIKNRYNIIVVFCGGMDIIHFSSWETIGDSLTSLFQQLQEKSSRVVYVSPPNVGLSPIFLFPVSWLYSYRAKRFLAISKECAQRVGVIHVDYFSSPMLSCAEDLSHPDDKEYRRLFELVKKYII